MCSNKGKNTVFNPVPSKPDYPSVEKEVQAFWESDGTFEESVRFRSSEGNDFVFYDGPPFANGLPHYGHVLTGYVKDVVPRYKTMQGYHVSRRFGWDCHGLPAEWKWKKRLVFTGVTR